MFRAADHVRVIMRHQEGNLSRPCRQSTNEQHRLNSHDVDMGLMTILSMPICRAVPIKHSWLPCHDVMFGPYGADSLDVYLYQEVSAHSQKAYKQTDSSIKYLHSQGKIRRVD